MLNRLLQTSFQRQLSVALGLGLTAAAVIIALPIIWVMRQETEALMATFTVRATEQLVNANVYLFVVGSEQPLADSLARFPGVRSVVVLDAAYQPLRVAGATAPSLPQTLTATPAAATVVVTEGALLHSLIPVDTPRQETASDDAVERYEAVPSASERLGYVHVVWDSAYVAEAVRGRITLIVALVFVVLALLFALLLQPLIRYSTGSLRALTTAILQAVGTRSATKVRAEVTGPAETRQLAQAFNVLMAERERTEDDLEAAVTARTQELHQALQLRDEFSAMVTHEMRTPLSLIANLAEAAYEQAMYLDESASAEHIRQYMDRILARAGELDQRIEEILQLRRLETGSARLKLTTVSLDELIAAIETTLKPLAERNQNSLTVAYQGKPTIRIDRDKLYRILTELITNACKFTRAGRIDVVLVADDRQLQATVTDTGIGIPAAQQPLIFEPFRQVDMSDARVVGGTGLGLTIIQKLCTLLGGSITVESTLGLGTRFVVVIPLPSAGDKANGQRPD